MKLKEEILEIINKEIVLQSTDCPWRYAPEFAAEKIVALFEQKLNIHSVSGKRPDLDATIKALEQMPDDKLDKLIKQVEAACAESAKDTVAERGACEHECTGPWDCQCQDILKEYYSGAGKSSEEQL